SRACAGASEVQAALEAAPADLIILGDEPSAPSFDELRAQLEARGADVPVIVLRSWDEGATLALMERGASDVVYREGLTRLGPALSRVLAEVRQRRSLRAAQDALARSEGSLKQVLEAM